jgi:resuscitation-promoting factor RpfB
MIRVFVANPSKLMIQSDQKKFVPAFYSGLVLLLILFLLFLAGCASVPPTSTLLNVSISLDKEVKEMDLPPGITVEKAVELAGFSIHPLDRISPPSYTIISEDLEIEIFRVTETFETEEILLSFETQTMKNETLPEGQTLLVQAGVNGVQQNTYRILFENGIEVSRTLIKQDLLVETKPEIIMVGVQTPYTEVGFLGKIAYLTAGNAWIMEQNSGNRKPVITSGDLDGRIFSLSPDGNWLLFTRLPEDESSEDINELWMLNISNENSKPIYLRVNNIIHFAEWHPTDKLTLAYSTVETRETAPGWQANNDLHIMSVNENGIILRREEVLETNSGGIYGWWGTEFMWFENGDFIVYARSDSIGRIDLKEGEVLSFVNILPLQTRGSWAWIPGTAVSPAGDILYFVKHGSSNANGPEDESSQDFSLSAFVTSNDYPVIDLVQTTGMFTYPVASPADQSNFLIAYLQAIFPEQSETSGYHLYIMDQDGSNRIKVFPPEGAPGLDPQKVVWQPVSTENSMLRISLIYQGNLWLLDIDSNRSYQLTGDGSISAIDWQ